MALLITELNAVKPFKTQWKIQVKIVHSWTQYTQYSGETVEMILADTSVIYDLSINNEAGAFCNKVLKL
ncbi:predicted protein [Arabidopsis lyrata subsp. lyrata]|uniref:Predicted protein n=1 Tax=Arabidopsis lyrata subsp. lyrata TaxID=81972 RepID=D7MIQ5_ARALL|nr:predicted protein [Arabidopsis lyrata subsp. lyrata]